MFSIIVKANPKPISPSRSHRLQKIAPLNNAVGMGRSFVVLGHGLIFAVNGDDVDGEVFGFVAKCALLLADGLAVVLGALSQIDGCGVVSHVCHMDGSPCDLSGRAGFLCHLLRCESSSPHVETEQSGPVPPWSLASMRLSKPDFALSSVHGVSYLA